jgi:hypothetical protein
LNSIFREDRRKKSICNDITLRNLNCRRA